VEPDPLVHFCRQTAYEYDPDNGSATPNLTVISVPVQSGGSWFLQEVSRRTHSKSGTLTVETQSTSPGGSELVTQTYYYGVLDGHEGQVNSPWLQRVKSVSKPDGTAAFYQYANSGGIFTTMESVGEPDSWYQPGSILNGRQTTTRRDSLGRILSVVATNIVEGVLTSQVSKQVYVYSSADPTGRDYYTYDLSGRTNFYEFACCGLSSVTDVDGVVTMYSYDNLGRQTGKTVLRGTSAVTYTNVVDGLGRTLVSLRIGSDGSVITNSQYQYDSQGRVIAETNAFNRLLKNRAFSGRLVLKGSFR
jgi:hypothetical protein